MADEREYFRSSDRPVEFEPPPLDAVMAFRGVWALCQLNKQGMLRATHFTSVLSGGPEPLWGVWTVNGNFQRFCTKRKRVAEAYPNHTWRHKQATWSLVAVHDMDESERRKQLSRLYGRGKTLTGEERAMVLRDLDMLTPPKDVDNAANVVSIGAHPFAQKG